MRSRACTAHCLKSVGEFATQALGFHVLGVLHSTARGKDAALPAPPVLAIRSCIPERLEAPFLRPKASQARDSGAIDVWRCIRMRPSDADCDPQAAAPG